jgi:uncharacterized membrane protein
VLLLWVHTHDRARRANVTTLVVLTMANVSAGDVLNRQSIAEPIVGCLGLIAAVPITTALT